MAVETSEVGDEHSVAADEFADGKSMKISED